jgi:Uma2 family endonuclease
LLKINTVFNVTLSKMLLDMSTAHPTFEHLIMETAYQAFIHPAPVFAPPPFEREPSFPVMNAQDFLALEVHDGESLRYELIHGTLVAKNAPSIKHQTTVRALFRALDSYVQEQMLGEVWFAPMTVMLSDVDCPQPDIVFVHARQQHIVHDWCIAGAPDLIIEVLSPSSGGYDRGVKMQMYAQYGVPEYWIVDPQNQCIEVYGVQSGRYEMVGFSDNSRASDSIESKVVDGFRIDAAGLFS